VGDHVFGGSNLKRTRTKTAAVNYKFNIDEWLPRFPLRPRQNAYAGEIITGPGHVCNNEHLRSELYDQFEWGRAVPVDVFVMADGEPEDPRVTKIGGLPLRSAELAWPTNEGGLPMTFIAQINFVDSRDITGDLPGDLLLVFSALEGAFGDFYFEWQDLNATELISADDLPEQSLRFDPCYGQAFRTMSYPDAKRIIDPKGQKRPLCRGLEVWGSDYLTRYQATQIGAAPYLIQDGDDEVPGRMLCTISSVHRDWQSVYPLVNHAEPLTAEEKWINSGRHLMIGDVGCIYISIDDDGNLQSRGSCY